jgi:transcriptional regulator with XRE-family HTH domain
MPTSYRPSITVRRTLKKLGLDLRAARIRRGLPAMVVAQRALTTRPTLSRIEQGDAGVGIGIYAAVMQVLGFLDALSELADPRHDEIGLALAAESLPKRARVRTLKTP